MFLFLIFIVVPTLEVVTFIKVGGQIGVLNTLLLTVITAIAGSVLLRTQGFLVWQRLQEKVAEDKFPFEEMFDGLCLFAAGIMLLTPGFVTDSFGLMLFFPPFRHLVYKWLKTIPEQNMNKGFSSFTVFTTQRTGEDGRTTTTTRTYSGGGKTIDGEYTDLDEDKTPPRTISNEDKDGGA